MPFAVSQMCRAVWLNDVYSSLLGSQVINPAHAVSDSGIRSLCPWLLATVAHLSCMVNMTRSMINPRLIF